MSSSLATTLRERPFHGLPRRAVEGAWVARPCYVAAICLLLLTGCRSAPKPQAGPHPQWPSGTEAPVRIVHRMDIRGPQDMGQPGLLDKIGQAIAGKSRQFLLRPQSIAVADKGKRLYIVDQELQGVHVLTFGSTKGQFLARAGDSYFVSPVGVAWCGDRLAVSDSGLREVFVLDRKGVLLARLRKPHGFQRPSGLGYDASRNRLYVVDTVAGEILAFDMRTFELVRSIGAPGSEPGQLHFPTYVAVDPAGRLLVADSLNFRVQAFDPDDGQPLFGFGQIGNASGYMAVPKGIGLDQFGHIYVVDSYLNAVQIFDRAGQLLLSFGDIGKERGQFQVPTGLAVTDDNRIYVCDSQNARVQMFEYIGGGE